MDAVGDIKWVHSPHMNIHRYSSICSLEEMSEVYCFGSNFTLGTYHWRKKMKVKLCTNHGLCWNVAFYKTSYTDMNL